MFNFDDIPSNRQRQIKQASIALIVVLLIVVSWGTQETESKQKTTKENIKQTKQVKLTDSELFESDIRDELNEKIQEKNKRIEDLDKKYQDLERLFQNNILGFVNADETKQSNAPKFGVPMPPSTGVITSNRFDGKFGNEGDMQIQAHWVGGIVSDEYEYDDNEGNSIDDKKNAQKKRIIRLPPSFMEGFLLTGMDAMTIEGSGDTPEPMMIRVQAPAVLPNDVKANLNGCFVIAEGYGNLATHRVDAKLRSLSCIDFKGKSIIFEKIKGFVQDADGKRGIKGQVVHRAGALIARGMIAGIFEGIGNAVTSSAQTTNISALGQTNNTPSSNLGKAAIGGGISSGAKDVRALFLQLAKQSSPIIEIGAAKKISVVITDLVDLKIQEL